MHACRIIFDVSSHLVALCFPHSSIPADLVYVCCFFFGTHNYFSFDRRWSCLFNTIFFSLFRFLSCQVRKNALIDWVFRNEKIMSSHDNLHGMLMFMYASIKTKEIKHHKTKQNITFEKWSVFFFGNFSIFRILDKYLQLTFIS